MNKIGIYQEPTDQNVNTCILNPDSSESESGFWLLSELYIWIQAQFYMTYTVQLKKLLLK
jgi:hypothetical protein